MPESHAMFSSAVLDEFIYIFGGNSSRIQQTENSGIVERYGKKLSKTDDTLSS